jgi:hypothetical protein
MAIRRDNTTFSPGDRSDLIEYVPAEQDAGDKRIDAP